MESGEISAEYVSKTIQTLSIIRTLVQYVQRLFRFLIMDFMPMRAANCLGFCLGVDSFLKPVCRYISTTIIPVHILNTCRKISNSR